MVAAASPSFPMADNDSDGENGLAPIDSAGGAGASGPADVKLDDGEHMNVDMSDAQALSTSNSSKCKYFLIDTVLNSDGVLSVMGAPSTSATLSKVEHESGLPTAHYRYTHGFSHGYGNSQVRVTCDHRSTQIWVLVMGAARKMGV